MRYVILMAVLIAGCSSDSGEVWYYDGVISEVGQCSGNGGVSITSLMGIDNQANKSVCRVRIESELEVKLWDMSPPLILGEEVKIHCKRMDVKDMMWCQVI